MATRFRGVSILVALLATVATTIVTMAPAAQAGTCTRGGDPAQYYCASSSSSFDGAWTYLGATINESASADGAGPAQAVADNAAVIFQNQGSSGWVAVSAQVCPNTVSCSTFFSTQGPAPTDQFLWMVFAADGSAQLIAGSFQYGTF
jgi:hypothetical protein